MNRLRFYYIFVIVYSVFVGIFVNIWRFYNRDTHANAFRVFNIYKKLAEKLNIESYPDNSGMYKIVQMRIFEKVEADGVSIVSQCSSNHFPSVEKLVAAWKGPVSIAVFSDIENIETTLWDLARFLYCVNREELGMQLVVPNQGNFDVYIKDYRFPQELLIENDKSVSCDLPYLSTLNASRNYNWKSLYPGNLLRNVARSVTSTDYVLVIDIDMIPSPNIYRDFMNFAEKRLPNLEKEVFVVPVFEVLPGSPIPSDKAELLNLLKLNQTRPFYIEPCENCQKLTNYDKWIKASNPGVEVLYQVEWKHPWEPFLIINRDVPYFDERFRQYGMNRVSQMCELHVAGFKFSVLDNVFLVHEGYKTVNDFHESKNTDMEANRRLYKQFKIEVGYKYWDSVKTC